VPARALQAGPRSHNRRVSAVPAIDRDLVFRARGITKVYRMGDVEVHALRGVDLELRRGEFVVLLGPSGSGKSTLLNILGGLDIPTAGHVWYEDHDLTEADERALTRFRREHVGFVFQFYNLIPSLTARENVEIVTEIADAPMPAREALERVGLGDRMDHFPAQLSGGQQQRVAVARALASRPDIIFADEPTGNLDSHAGAEVLHFLRQAVDQLGQTIVMVTHDPTAASTADRILFLADGRVVDEMRDPTPERVLERMKRFGE
jgi:putative ABC transport system ATP-binding protein